MNQITLAEHREIRRRLALGHSRRRIAREMLIHRDTVCKYAKIEVQQETAGIPEKLKGRTPSECLDYINGQIAYLSKQYPRTYEPMCGGLWTMGWHDARAWSIEQVFR